MAIGLKLITAPGSEPVSLADCKTYLRLASAFTADDTTITNLLYTFRQQCELKTGLTLISTVWEQSIDKFPRPRGGGWMYYYPVAPYGYQYDDYLYQDGPAVVRRDTIELVRSPVTAVASVKYNDTTGTQQTMDPSTYTVDLTTKPARIAPAFGTIWPISQPGIDQIVVRFTAGYTNAAAVLAAVPQAVTWICAKVDEFYNNRGASNPNMTGGAMSQTADMVCDSLLDQISIAAFG